MPHKQHKEEIEKPDEEGVEPDAAAQEPRAAAPVAKTDAEQAEEYLNDLKRLQADFENYKKRQQESQKELSGYLIGKLVLDIIPVLDNFRQATLHVPPEHKDSPWVTGIQYIEKQLETVLTDNGMQTIEVKEGDDFDPTIHEAISHEHESGEDADKHTIAQVIQKGYRLGDKVIRAARVIVK